MKSIKFVFAEQENTTESAVQTHFEQTGQGSFAQSIDQKGFRDNTDLLNVIASYSQVLKIEKQTVETFLNNEKIKRLSSSK